MASPALRLSFLYASCCAVVLRAREGIAAVLLCLLLHRRLVRERGEERRGGRAAMLGGRDIHKRHTQEAHTRMR